MFSLQKFLQMLIYGEDIAITSLHSKDVLIDSDIFKYLRENRKKFYTKRILGASKYAKSQSLKYALRADRMNAVKLVIEKLEDAVSRGVLKIYQIYQIIQYLIYLCLFLILYQ